MSIIEVWQGPIPEHFSDRSFLSPDEKQKADSFHFAKDRSAYIFCRGTLRRLISLYTAIPPGDLVFSYNEFGKPGLDHRLKFNLSHTAGRAVFAFTLDAEIGVDLEKMVPILEMGEIAAHFPEAPDLEQLAPAERMKAFFQFWTKKEALLKALGFGFGKNHNLNMGGWFVQELACSAGYAGAIAYAGKERKIDYRTL